MNLLRELRCADDRVHLVDHEKAPIREGRGRGWNPNPTAKVPG
jgi:hypothetical protein